MNDVKQKKETWDNERLTALSVKIPVLSKRTILTIAATPWAIKYSDSRTATVPNTANAALRRRRSHNNMGEEEEAHYTVSQGPRLVKAHHVVPGSNLRAISYTD